MYFEPAKKTYYRFPSIQSINKLDSKLYFPEKTKLSEEEIRNDVNTNRHVPDRDTYYNI